MKQFVIYRNGSQSTAQRIGAAMTHYIANHEGALPVAVVVNPKDLDAVTEHVKALDLSLPVISNGGVAGIEVWLQVTQGGKHA